MPGRMESVLRVRSVIFTCMDPRARWLPALPASLSRLALCSSLALAAVLAGCGGDSVERCTSPGTGVALTLNAQQRVIADQVVSVFENDTPVLQYGYAENIHDGRGITAGRAGFTSATGDLLAVVERYSLRVPGNGLAVYLPRLRQLAPQASDSTDGLEGLEAAWQVAAADTAFRRVQDEIVDQEYYLPAVEHAANLGLACPLGLLALYDTSIQHGDGDDPDGLPAIIATATREAGGTPGSGVDDQAWIRAFLAARRAVLLNPSDPSTKDAWAESVGRVDALLAIVNAANFALTPPIVINPYGTSYSLPAP